MGAMRHDGRRDACAPEHLVCPGATCAPSAFSSVHIVLVRVVFIQFQSTAQSHALLERYYISVIVCVSVSMSVCNVRVCRVVCLCVLRECVRVSSVSLCAACVISSVH